MRVVVEGSSKGQLIVNVGALPDGRAPDSVVVEVTGPPVTTAEAGTYLSGGRSWEVFALSPGETQPTVQAVYRRAVDIAPSDAQAAGTIIAW